MNQLALADWRPLVDGIAVALLRKASLGRVSLYGTDYIPLDIDVSVLEYKSSNKEGVEMSYHKVKGYAPIFCYAGTQGYMVANENTSRQPAQRKRGREGPQAVRRHHAEGRARGE